MTINYSEDMENASLAKARAISLALRTILESERYAPGECVDTDSSVEELALGLCDLVDTLHRNGLSAQ